MREYTSVTIRTNQQANDMLALCEEVRPEIGAFDTETNGLHIILSKPFLFQFGFLHPTKPIGYTFVVDIQRQPELAEQVIRAWHYYARKLNKYLAHNAKFDLHMLANIGMAYTTENVSDSMFYIRYAHDAIAPKNGGPPLGLKDYCARYVDPRAKTHDRLIQRERSAIAKTLNQQLRLRLASCGRPPAEYGAASYTLGVLEKIFKDPIADATALPTEECRQAYDDWLHLDVPAEIRHAVSGLVNREIIPYSWCDRETVIEYGHLDIVYTLETYEQCAPIVKTRGNEHGIAIEEQTLFPWWEMERVGFAADVDYLKQAKEDLKNYIQQQRQQLYDLCGERFSIAQHKKILHLLRDRGVQITSTQDDELSLIKTKLIQEDPNSSVVRIITLIQELRTLEKWYSTYVTRFLLNLHDTDRLYTQVNQVGTVSGRVTSDFQQFPKGGIKTETGELLFHPRRVIRKSGEEYPAIVYLDFSQIELRFQAIYTILVGHPDLNLCRAYMPYECHTTEDGTLKAFDYRDPWCMQHAYDRDWYYNETPDKHWVPTDVHGATTKAAFDIDETDPRFHDLRYVGKRVNFAKNYGAQFKKIWSMFPEYDEAAARKIDGAYYAAFPGVKSYHSYCYERADYFSNTANLFNIKYYGVSGHKLINLLVQGSAAYYLKLKIRELYDYSKAHNLKTRWQMQVHDELSWEYHRADSLQHLFEFKRIMETWPDALVPIVADMEITTSSWDAKKEVDSIDALQNYLSA